MALIVDGSDLGRQRARGEDLQLGTQLNLFTELLQELIAALEFAGLNIEGHLIYAVGVSDHDLPALGLSKRPSMLPSRGLVHARWHGLLSM